MGGWDLVKSILAVRKNSTGTEFRRQRINLIEGSGVTLTVADDRTDDEIDVTIAAATNISYVNSTAGKLDPLSTAYTQLNTVSLTAGTWLVSGQAVFDTVGGAGGNSDADKCQMNISTTSGALSSGTVGDNEVWGDLSRSTTTGVRPKFVTLNIVDYPMTVGGTTSIYLNAKANYSVNNPVIQGSRLTALKVS